MKVLVTGGAGFVGSHYIEHLLKNTDAEIVLIDRLDASGNLNRLYDIDTWEKYRHRVKFVWHDFKAPINSQIARKIGAVHRIVHIGASSHVDRSIEDPISFVMDNVVGTTNILNYARGLDTLDEFLYFSTDEVFGPCPTGYAYKEWDRYFSANPYAASKAGGEEMCLAFANTYKLPILITHTMNVFGERQHPEKFIPLVISKVLREESVYIHADEKRTKAGSRFYVHARNVAQAVEFVFEHGTFGDKYNIVGEQEVDNLELALMVAAIVGKPLKYELVDFHSSRPGHDLRYALDGARLKAMGWKIPVALENSLHRTVKWYLKNREWIN